MLPPLAFARLPSACILAVALPISTLAMAAPTAPPTDPAAPPTAPAPAGHDAVDAHVEAGMAKYEAKDYVGAAAEFKAAYALDADPNLLYNIGRTYEEGAQLELAVEYYRRFAQQPGIELELRKQAVDRIKVLEEVLEQTKPKPAEPAPAPAPEPAPAPAPAPTDDPPGDRPGRGLRISGYVLIGLGASALAAGGVLGGLARRDAATLETTADPQSRLDVIDRAERKALLADVMLIGGGAVAATGLVLALVGVSKGRRARSERVALGPMLTPQGAGATLRMRF